MEKKGITVSQALGWRQTLQHRQQELVTLRNQNSQITRTRYGSEPAQEIKPVYDALKLDRRITLIGREIRLLDDAIKTANATITLPGYDKDEGVLGELEV